MTGSLEKYEELGVNAFISMGKLSFSREALGAVGMPEETADVTLTFNRIPFRCACADLGGAHCIVPLPDISSGLADRIAQSPEIRGYFPHGVSLELVHVLNRDTVQIELRQIFSAQTESAGKSPLSSRAEGNPKTAHGQLSLNGCCAAAGALHSLGIVNARVTLLAAGEPLCVCVDEALRTSIPRPVAFSCRNLLV